MRPKRAGDMISGLPSPSAARVSLIGKREAENCGGLPEVRRSTMARARWSADCAGVGALNTPPCNASPFSAVVGSLQDSSIGAQRDPPAPALAALPPTAIRDCCAGRLSSSDAASGSSIPRSSRVLVETTSRTVVEGAYKSIESADDDARRSRVHEPASPASLAEGGGSKRLADSGSPARSVASRVSAPVTPTCAASRECSRMSCSYR